LRDKDSYTINHSYSVWLMFTVAAQLHVARGVCRRAERALVALTGSNQARPDLVIYLNRLSDLLFALARVENQATGVADVPWNPPRKS